MYYFRCSGCGADKKSLLTPGQAALRSRRCQCGGDFKRDPQGASSRVVEVLDNGVMSRRVERPADVERLNWERAHKPVDRS